VGFNKIGQILGAEQHPGPELDEGNFPFPHHGSHRMTGDAEAFRRLIDTQKRFTINIVPDYITALVVFHILILALI
jgi:hypothetical protein